jgi:very-short-patch-repair endonuclease
MSIIQTRKEKGKECLCCGCLLNNSHRSRRYCKKEVCQRYRKKLCREHFFSKLKDSKEYIREKSKICRRKSGVMPRGGSQYEEQIYKKLLKYFNKNDIIRNTKSIITNPHTKHWLELDFYIPKLKTAFEVDGETHRQSNAYGIKRLEYQISIDKIKDKVCKDNGITLVRIPFGKDINIFGTLSEIHLSDLEQIFTKT